MIKIKVMVKLSPVDLRNMLVVLFLAQTFSCVNFYLLYNVMTYTLLSSIQRHEVYASIFGCVNKIFRIAPHNLL